MAFADAIHRSIMLTKMKRITVWQREVSDCDALFQPLTLHELVFRDTSFFAISFLETERLVNMLLIHVLAFELLAYFTLI